LEGTSIGEERQKDPKSRTYYLAKQRKCVCQSVCRCSRECTNDLLHSCPCAERHVRIMMVKRGLHYRLPNANFATTAGTLTRMYFHGLASLKRGVTERHIAQELHRAFESISHLISSEREKVPKRSPSEKSTLKKSFSENYAPKRSFSDNSVLKRNISGYSAQKDRPSSKGTPKYDAQKKY